MTKVESDIEISEQLTKDIMLLIDEKPAVHILPALITVINSLHANCFNNSIEEFAERNKDLLIRLHYHLEDIEERTIQ